MALQQRLLGGYAVFSLRIMCPRLMHEGFKSGKSLGVSLAFISYVKNRNIVMILSYTLEYSRCDGAGHAGEGHHVHNAGNTAIDVVNGLTNG